MHPTYSVKYLGAKNDNKFTWKADNNDIAIKMNGAMLYKISYYVNTINLKIGLLCFIWITHMSAITHITSMPV